MYESTSDVTRDFYDFPEKKKQKKITKTYPRDFTTFIDS